MQRKSAASRGGRARLVLIRHFRPAAAAAVHRMDRRHLATERGVLEEGACDESLLHCDGATLVGLTQRT